ncbi:MAG: MMPL family transporter [Armatimonadetes bacterium]|nr:MMPL family transporter [Armatimonadota bacterium]
MLKLVELATTRPKLVIAVVLLVTGLFMSQFPKVKTDTDPKHMLPATSAVRVYNDAVEEHFQLHADWIVLGIVNAKGVLNPTTLAKVARLTNAIVGLPGVVPEDVISFTTADNVLADEANLYVKPVMAEVPQTGPELAALRRALIENPLLMDRLYSRDGQATAIYIPLATNANGKIIADQIRGLLRKADDDGSGDEFHLAGDPVARDSFGAEMSKQMGIFSPIAGAIMFAALLLMFRSLVPVIACMGVSMVCVIWAMGGTIGLGIPIHIMSSMSPVFLMAISTDTVHIFNEFYFRFRETADKRRAILDSLRVVGRPLIYTDLTTAAAFASLAVGDIIPVRVFGLLVAFGTLVLLLMSFTLTPALLSLMNADRLAALTRHEDMAEGSSARWLSGLARFSLRYGKAVVAGGLLLVLVSLIGVSRIRVNNNLVQWFKPHSDIRVGDAVLNRELGGTATAYLVVQGGQPDAMQQPEVLSFIEGLQRELEKSPLVGKTTSLADVVKRVSRVMHADDPRYEVIPDSADAVAQYLLLFSMAAKPRDLNNFVDYPMQQANLWVQLKTWDAVGMQQVQQIVEQYKSRALPAGSGKTGSLSIRAAGIAYFNLVWNQAVLWGMLYGFIVSCVLVLFLMSACFRCPTLGVIAGLPLLFTILVIYGLVGFIGKDFDMPIAVLSTLSLGLATDFAVHFIDRYRQRRAEVGPEACMDSVLAWTVARPGKGIVRNAVLFALGFSAMLFAALTPYITVGLFMAAIMLLSALATLTLLPILVKAVRSRPHGRQRER